MFTDPLSLVRENPAALLVIVFAAAAIEYVFPPFWGDTLLLAGCFVAGLDDQSAAPVFLAAVLGSCVGAIGAWWMGRRFGQVWLRLFRRSHRARRIAERAEALYARHGSRVLAFNRFLPGVRALFLPLAGAGNMPFRPVLVWSSVSNLLYCGVIVAAGFALAARTSDFAALQEQFRIVMAVAAVIAVATLLTLTVRHFVTRQQG